MSSLEEKWAKLQKLLEKSSANESRTGDDDVSANADDFLQRVFFKKTGSHLGNATTDLTALFPVQHSSSQTARINMSFGITLMILGLIAVLLNLLILTILALHRRHVLKHAFYMLICNFAFIDSLKGFFLILWAAKTLVKTDSGNISLIKIEQVTLIILRFANLGTILNLLMITLNEFAFIKFPLRYHTLVTKRRILLLVIFSWMLSLAFTLLTTFARSKVEGMTIVSCPNGTSLNGTGISRFGDKCVQHPDNTDTDSGLPLHTIFTFTLIGFCIVCLLVVIVCYTIFFRIIHRIRKEDAILMAQINDHRKSSTHQRRRSSTNSCYFYDMHPPTDEKKLKKHLLRRSKYVLVIGSVIFIYILYLFSYGTIQVLQTLRTGTGHSALIIRWSFRLLIGLHSIFQPLCYFRMTEFRQFVNKSLGYPCQKRPGSAGNPFGIAEWVSTSTDREQDHLVHPTRKQSRVPPGLSAPLIPKEPDENIMLKKLAGNGCIQPRKSALSCQTDESKSFFVNQQDNTFSTNLSEMSEATTSNGGAHTLSVQFSACV